MSYILISESVKQAVTSAIRMMLCVYVGYLILFHASLHTIVHMIRFYQLVISCSQMRPFCLFSSLYVMLSAVAYYLKVLAMFIYITMGSLGEEAHTHHVGFIRQKTSPCTPVNLYDGG